MLTLPHFVTCAQLGHSYVHGEMEGPPIDDKPLQELHRNFLRVMDVLADAGKWCCCWPLACARRADTCTAAAHRNTAPLLSHPLPAAGYRPATFTVALGDGAPTRCYPPDEHSAKWGLNGSRKWLWLVAQRPPWSPANHGSFPPAFRAAGRTLLLAAHRSTAEVAGPGGGASLGALPQPLLHAILARAAYPLSAWRPSIDTSSMLEQLEEAANKLRAEEKAERDWLAA